MAWSEADIPDQTGRVAVVTGANGGLGYEIARALAIKGARVIMAARDQGRATQARERILSTGNALAPEIVPLDLGSLDSIAAAADAIATALRTPGARMVTVTSTARHAGRPVDPDRPLDMGRYDPWLAYGRSKLANLHFAVGLHERLRGAGADTASLAAHPGLSDTGLQATGVRTSGGDSASGSSTCSRAAPA